MATEVGNDSDPGKELAFERTIPTIQIAAATRSQISPEIGISKENIPFGNLGGGIYGDLFGGPCQ